MRTSADIYTDFSQLADLKRQSKQDKNAALKEVAKQFEAVFVQMMLKQMRQASPGDPIFDSNRSQFYRDMHDQQLALHLSDRGNLGIADMIVRQLGDRRTPGASPQSLEDYRAEAISSEQVLGVEEGRRERLFERSPHSTLPPAGGGPGRGGVNTSDWDIPDSSNPLSAFSENRSEAGKEIRSTPPNRFESPQQFLRTLYPEAKEVADKIGLDPKLLLAQAALETGWGQKVIHHSDGRSSHNLFNIKAGRRWPGEKVQVDTLEYLDGVAVKKRAAFRAYPDYRQSFEDYLDLLRRPRYAEALQHTDDPRHYLNALQRAGYATDPHYADKILSIYQREYSASL
ncbi:flagellar assembly peptidoglycan hydrolase FlgJ [Methylohalobius crimeensis]|uniref:flagellar assembly peptidoglycan hydrolase FlgJ n=1 Tax=Methylohalobius crimeensis TaxID=244365 RepID=UPI0003B4D7C5|nr:flagellar assembly peptidoglycan hydrolase FlgJ [Methylohalobius crimeensis]